MVQQLHTQSVKQQALQIEDDNLYKCLENRITPSVKVKKNKPKKYDNKDSATSWATHINNYLKEALHNDSLLLAVSFPFGTAQKCRIVFKGSDDGQQIRNRTDLKKALDRFLNTLNKKYCTRQTCTMTSRQRCLNL